MIEHSRGRALSVLASCAVHAGIVLGVPRDDPAIGRTAVQPLWMELRVEPVPAPPALREPPRAVASGEPVPHELPHVAVTRRSRSARIAEARAPDTDSDIDARAAAVTAERSSPSARAATVNLSPLAAARTLGDPTAFEQRDSGVSREEQPLSNAAQAHTLAQQVPGLRASKGPERGIEGVAVDVVEDSLYNVLRPWKLFTRTMRGSEYRYTGGGFDAAILPDGRVRFRDKDGLVLTVTVTQTREFGPGLNLPPAPGGALSLGDPRALWYRLRGQDPHAAERRSFLERTRALREHLAGRAANLGRPERGDDVESEQPRSEPPANSAAAP